MTDNEILRAWDCCMYQKCEYCNRYNKSVNATDCKTDLMVEICFLLKRQKAEIERLKEQLADTRHLNTIAADEATKEFMEMLKNGEEQWIEQNT